LLSVNREPLCLVYSLLFFLYLTQPAGRPLKIQAGNSYSEAMIFMNLV
jgi:hypothetical protein